MADPFLSTIMVVGFDFAPRNWAFCNGQILAISTNQALFSLLGTTFGGDGVRTFALPNLQGRAAVGAGALHPLGQVGGEATHTLTTQENPQHNHVWHGSATAGNSTDPTANALGGNKIYIKPDLKQPPPKPVAMNAKTISTVGGNPHPNQSPYLVLNYCIALQGIFPSRS